MPQIAIDATRLLAASLFVSDEETRYYLNGLYVMPAPDPETGRGALLVATDGHRLAMIYDREGIADTGRILKLDWKAKALKRQRGEPARMLHIDGLKRGESAVAQIRLGYEPDSEQVDTLTVHEIDAEYVQWWNVLPGEPNPEIALHGGHSLNPFYLLDFDKAFRLLTGNKDGHFAVLQPERGGAAWVLNNEVPDALFVIMPIHHSEKWPGVPGWIDAAVSARG